MAVPRKRIKLDQTVVAKQPPKDQPVEKPPKAAPVSNLKTRSARQLDEAFEIMEQIPYRETAGTKTLEPAPGRTGFRWKISLEAVLPDNTSAGSEDQSSQSQRSSLMALGFTIPFFWGWPIFGAMTKSFLKNFEPYRNLDLFWMLEIGDHWQIKTICLPGTHQIQNAIPMPYFGTTALAAPISGLVGAAIMFGGGLFWINQRAKAALDQGEGDGYHEAH